MMLTSEQLRAARATLRWDQARLAAAAAVSTETIKRLERLDGHLGATRVDTLDKLRRALEAAGVEFIPENGGGAGVRLRKPTLATLRDVALAEWKRLSAEVRQGHAAVVAGDQAASPSVSLLKAEQDAEQRYREAQAKVVEQQPNA